MKTHQNQSVNKSRAKCWLHRCRPGQLTKRPDYVPHQSPSTMITLWRSTPLRTQHSRVAQVFKTPFSLQPSDFRPPPPLRIPLSILSRGCRFITRGKTNSKMAPTLSKCQLVAVAASVPAVAPSLGSVAPGSRPGWGGCLPQPAGFSIITMAVAVAVVMMMPVHWCTDFAWLPASNLRCRAFFVHWAKAEMFI